MGFSSYYLINVFKQQKEAFKKRWFILDSQNRKLLYFRGQLVRREPIKVRIMFCLLIKRKHFNHNYVSRMQKSWARFSLAQRKSVILRGSVPRKTPGETSGIVVLWWRHRSDNLSSCVSRRGSRKSGWMRSNRSCPGPWRRRIIPVSRDEQRPV